MEINDLPPLKNTSPFPVLAPVFPGFIPFAISTSQHCVLPKNLLRKVYHPYKDPVGQCHCEPGGWCNDLPCSGWKQCVSRKIRGHNSSHGSSWLGGSCCSTSEEPCNNQGTSCGGHTPTCHRTLFLLIFFIHFQPNFTSHSLPHISSLWSSLLCSFLYVFHAHKQTTRIQFNWYYWSLNKCQGHSAT